MKTNFHRLALIITTSLLFLGCGGKKKDAVQAVNPTAAPAAAQEQVDPRVKQVVSSFEKLQDGSIRYSMQFGTRDEQGTFHSEWTDSFILDSNVEDGVFNKALRQWEGNNEDGIVNDEFKDANINADLALNVSLSNKGQYILSGTITGTDFRGIGKGELRRFVKRLPVVVMELNLVYFKMTAEAEKEPGRRSLGRRNVEILNKITPFLSGIQFEDALYSGTVTIYTKKEWDEKHPVKEPSKKDAEKQAAPAEQEAAPAEQAVPAEQAAPATSQPATQSGEKR